MKVISRFLSLAQHSYFHIVLLVVLSMLLLLRHSHKPFVGLHDFNGVDYGVYARNHLQLGLEVTKFGSLSKSGTSIPVNPPEYYTHHPFVLPLIITASYALLGVSEFSTRLPFILFSTAALASFYLLFKQLTNKLTALFACLLVMLTPMYLYYGKVVTHEPLLFLLLSILLLSYYHYLQKPQSFQWLVVTTVLIGLSGWPGYFFIPGLIIHNLLFYRGTFHKKLLLLPLVLMATFGFHLIHIKILTGSFFGGGFGEVFLFRLNSDKASIPAHLQFTWPEYIRKEIHVLKGWTSPLLSIFSIIWITGLAYTAIKHIKNRTKLTAAQRFIPVFFLTAIGYPLVFTNAVFIHDYLLIFFLPFICLTSAIVIFNIVINNNLPTWFQAMIIATVIIVYSFNYANPIYLQNAQLGALPNEYRLGQAINQVLEPGEVAVVNSSLAGINQITYFYADRDVFFADILNHPVVGYLDKKVDYLVLTANSDVEKAFILSKSQKNHAEIVDGFFFIKQTP